jgi:hypothetical protein
VKKASSFIRLGTVTKLQKEIEAACKKVGADYSREWPQDKGLVRMIQHIVAPKWMVPDSPDHLKFIADLLGESCSITVGKHTDPTAIEHQSDPATSGVYPLLSSLEDAYEDWLGKLRPPETG